MININMIITANWVIRDLGMQIYNRQPNDMNITISQSPIDKEIVDIYYYFAFENFKRKTNKLDVGFFTHPNNNEFRIIGKKLDHCIVMAKQYESMLLSSGIPKKNISLIYPGVSKDFRPKIKILNPVKMTTKERQKRKGKELWDRVCSLPFVQAECSNGKYTKKELLDLFHSSDIILSTSTLEGGPMCIIEGLSCGKPVIARKNVGFVDDINGILTYSNFEELKNILESIYKDKLKIYNNVKDFTVENWTDNHYDLFRKLVGAKNEK